MTLFDLPETPPEAPAEVAKRPTRRRTKPAQLALASVSPCPMVVELCAGSAAFTLAVLAAGAKPPISYQGSKSGYVAPLLRLAGLSPGQGASRVLLCDPGPWSRVWAVLADPVLRAEVVRILRGWSAEEPRPLWDRLKAELKEQPISGPDTAAGWLMVRGNSIMGEGRSWMRQAEGHGDSAITTDEIARRIAGYTLAHDWSFSGRGPEKGYGGPGAREPSDFNSSVEQYMTTPRLAARVEQAAQWIQVAASNRLICVGGDGRNTGQGGSTFGGEDFGDPAAEVAARVEQVAAHLATAARSYGANPDKGYQRTAGGSWPDRPPDLPVEDVERLPGALLDVYAGSAMDLDPVALGVPDGTVTLIDPPYLGTSGYADDLPRADVVTLARRWRSAGARVLVCEQDSIPELVAEGWGTYDMTHERRAQKRTFSLQQREIVTVSP